MKKAEAIAEVERFVAHYRPMLAVDARTKITVEWERELDAMAATHQWHHLRAALVVIGRNYVRQPERERRQTIVHELLHIAQHGPYTTVAQPVTEGLLGKAEHFMLTYTREHELFTDTLAEVLVDLLPAPC